MYKRHWKWWESKAAHERDRGSNYYHLMFKGESA